MIESKRFPFSIVLAEDDADDRMMILRALKQSGVTEEIRPVTDGAELMDLLRSGDRAMPSPSPHRPGLVLLDLNMPRKSGREALREIKNDPHLRSIPVVVLSTSNSDNDVFESYDVGANAFITKPPTYTELAEIIGAMSRFWLETARLPIN